LKIDFLPGKFWVGAKFAREEGGEKGICSLSRKAKF